MGKAVWIGIACLGLFAIILLVGFLSFLGSTASEGDLISIRGIGNSGNTVYSSMARRRAIKALTIAAGPRNPAWEHVRKTAAEKLLVANRSPAAAASGAAAMMSPMILDGDPLRWPGQE